MNHRYLRTWIAALALLPGLFCGMPKASAQVNVTSILAEIGMVGTPAVNVPEAFYVDVYGNYFVASTIGAGLNPNSVLEVPANGAPPFYIITGLTNIRGVAADSLGNVYISQTGVSTILKVAPGGTTSTIGSGLLTPYQLALDSSNNLYVADAGHARIVKITTMGTSTQTVLGFTGLVSPHGVAVDPSGNVYATSDSSSAEYITELLVSGTQVTYAISGVAGGYGIYVDAAGDIYITDIATGRMIEYPYPFNTATQIVSPVTLGGSAGSVMVTPRGNAAFNYDKYVYEQQVGAVNFYGVTVGATSAQTFTAITFNNPTASAIKLASTPFVYLSNNATTAQFAVSTMSGMTTTCTASLSLAAGANCTLYLAFVPTQAGLITGTLNMMSSTGTVLATLPLMGVGDGPVAALAPGTQSTYLSTSGSPATALGQPMGTSVDAGGNLYLADSTKKIVTKTTSGGVTTTLAFTGLGQPTGVAVDGAGSVYVADAYNNAVYKLTTGGTQTTIATTGLKSPTGIALDGYGNLYIADSGNARIVKVSAAGVQSTLPMTGLSNPTWLAVNLIGEVYVVDTGAVYEYSSIGVQSTITTTGLGAAAGIAVSANGSLYIADSSKADVYALPYAGSSGIASFGAPYTLASGFTTPTGIALASNGNLYIVDSGAARVWLLSRVQDTLAFSSTASGATSVALTAQLQNVGNNTLTLSGLAFSSGYTQATPVNASTDCSAVATVLVNASCNVNTLFTPTALGSIPGTATITDNSLNAASATQTITLTGTGITATSTAIAQTTPSSGNPVYGQALTLTTTVSPTSGTGTPTGSVVFTVDGNASGSISLSSGQAAYSPTGLTAGSHSVTAAYSGDTSYAASTSAAFTLTVAPAVLNVTAVAQNRQYNVANAALAYNITGFAYSDTVAVVSGSPVLSTTAITTSDPGSYPITVTQGTLAAANYTFNLVPAAIVVIKATNTISFPTLANVTYGASPITPLASANSSLPITYSVLSGPASVTNGAGAAITITGAGQVVIAANQAGNTDYAVATQATQSFTVVPATLTVTAANQSKLQGASNPTLTYVLSGYVYSDTSAVVSGTPSITTTAVTNSAVGTYPITITQGTLTAANYSFSFVNATLTITGNTAQSITFGALSNLTYGAAPITLSATASSGLAVNYLVSGPASLNGSVLTILGIGKVTIVASQAGNNVYAAASTVTQSFNVLPATLTVTPVNAVINYGAAIPSFTYTITGYVNGDATTVVSGAPTITTTAALNSPVGTYPITASLGGLLASNYIFAFTPGTLTINTDPQTITFGSLPAVAYGVTPITLAATSTSGLSITYTVTGPATVSGSTLTITGAGQVAVTAAQAGNATTVPAANVTQGFTVNPAVLTVTATSISLPYTTTMTIPTTFAYTITGFVNGDPQSVVSGAPTFTTNVPTPPVGGSYSITPAQGTLSAANYVFTNLVSGTLTISPTSQTITFAALSNVPQTTGSITLTATASSGLPITYTATGPVTITGSVLKITGPGAATVTATQPGNSSYSAAISVTQSFTVTATTTVSLVISTSAANPANTVNQGVNVTLTATISGKVTAIGVPTGLVNYYSFTGTSAVLIGTATVTASSGGVITAVLSSTKIPTGSLSITAAYSGDVNYTTSTSSAQSLLVIAPDVGITAPTASLTVTASTPGSTVITLTPVGGYSQTVTFSCVSYPAVVPSGLSCSFSPVLVNFYNGTAAQTLPQYVTLTVSEGAQTSMLKQQRSRTAMAALVLGIFAAIIPMLTRRRKGAWRRFSQLLVLLLAIGAIAGLSGCGNSQTVTAVKPGVYNITVFFTDDTTTSHNLSFAVNVQ
jgi:sugar lactone lactonase YvrE